ncbi:MAG: hypothetical protein K9K76_09380 [Halanaerobiales bacterium]|nr:hypothetical protein [Halanaerobiales bacterium]
MFTKSQGLFLKKLLMVLVIVLLVFPVSTEACEFIFNFDRIEAPLGKMGEIRVRVYKTHNNCTLNGMEEYYFETSNVQTLEETEWKEIEKNVYEKWFKVLLSEKGEGYLLIWKDCTKEGYEEKSLPINVIEGNEDVALAVEGKYPYQIEKDSEIRHIEGYLEMKDDRLSVNDLILELPDTAAAVMQALEEIKVKSHIFYEAENKRVLLIANDDSYYYFDYSYEKGVSR